MWLAACTAVGGHRNSITRAPTIIITIVISKKVISKSRNRGPAKVPTINLITLCVCKPPPPPNHGATAPQRLRGPYPRHWLLQNIAQYNHPCLTLKTKTCTVISPLTHTPHGFIFTVLKARLQLKLSLYMTRNNTGGRRYIATHSQPSH